MWDSGGYQGVQSESSFSNPEPWEDSGGRFGRPTVPRTARRGPRSARRNERRHRVLFTHEHLPRPRHPSSEDRRQRRRQRRQSRRPETKKVGPLDDSNLQEDPGPGRRRGRKDNTPDVGKTFKILDQTEGGGTQPTGGEGEKEQYILVSGVSTFPRITKTRKTPVSRETLRLHWIPTRTIPLPRVCVSVCVCEYVCPCVCECVLCEYVCLNECVLCVSM